jgi:transposase-like protein
MIKEMDLQGVDWGEVRPVAQTALREVLEQRMHGLIGNRIAELAANGRQDRRNGSYRRWLLTALGAIELSVPRSRTCSAAVVLGRYARRERTIDRLILACFVLGLSTRKVGEALLTLLGQRVSPATVSRVAQTLDEAVAAFHRRPLANRYRVLVLDGVVLSRKTGGGALRRPVLVALGIRLDGRKEIVDFRLAPAESRAAWEEARRAARQLTERWRSRYPAAVRCLVQDLDALLEFLRFDDPLWRTASRTTNAIERRFREVRRRTRPMGVFSDRTSIERILFAVFTYENHKQGTSAPFLLTHNS